MQDDTISGFMRHDRQNDKHITSNDLTRRVRSSIRKTNMFMIVDIITVDITNTMQPIEM